MIPKEREKERERERKLLRSNSLGLNFLTTQTDVGKQLLHLYKNIATLKDLDYKSCLG